MKVKDEIDIFTERQESICEEITENGNDPLFIDGFEGGLIGYECDEEGFIHAVYSEEQMLDYYCRVNDCQYEDAYDFYSFNTLRSLPYCDERNRPRIIHTM